MVLSSIASDLNISLMNGNLNILQAHHTTVNQMEKQSAVQIAKKILKKANRDGKDNWKVILDWRNTPTVDMNSSPVQRLMLRRTRTLLPTTKSHLTPRGADNVKEKIEHKRQKAKYYYDKTAKELQKLDIGDVRVRPTIRSEKWKLGETIDNVNSRSYIVDVNGALYAVITETYVRQRNKFKKTYVNYHLRMISRIWTLMSQLLKQTKRLLVHHRINKVLIRTFQ